MNRRNKIERRRRSYLHAKLEALADIARKNPPTDLVCKRCNQPIKNPHYLVMLKKWCDCCSDCQFRNFMDALDLPTPRQYLDRFTVNPQLL